MTGALLTSAAVLGLQAALGLALAGAIRPNIRGWRLLPFAYPLGAGVLTWSLFLCSWVGLKITAVSAGVVLALLLGGALTAWRLARMNSPGGGRDEARSGTDRAPVVSAGDLASLVGILAFWAWGSWLAVERSYSAWDAAAIWSVKGYGIAQQGTVFAGWGAHGLSYPLNLPLQIAFHQLVNGDLLPGSKLLYPVYLLSLLAAALGFWRSFGVRPWTALLCVLLIGTVPVVFEHATNGYADLPFAVYLALATMMALESAASDDRRGLVLAGLLLGLAVWTRLEGPLYSAAVLGALLAPRVIDRSTRHPLTPIMVGLALIAGPWLLFYRLYGAQGSQAATAWSAMLESLRGGGGDWYPLRLIFGFGRRQVIDPAVWGLALPAAVMLVVLTWRRASSRVRHTAGVGLLTAGLMGLVTVSLYFGMSFVAPDFTAWMGQYFSRGLLPAAAGVAISVPLLTARRQERPTSVSVT